MAASLQYLPPSLHGLPPLCFCFNSLPLFPLIRIQSLHLRPTLNPGWSHLEIQLICTCKDPFKYGHISRQGLSTWDLPLVGHYSNPLQHAKASLPMRALVFECGPLSTQSEPAGPFPRHTGSQKHFTPSETTFGVRPRNLPFENASQVILASVWEPLYQAPENWNSSIYYSVNLPETALCGEIMQPLGHGVVMHACCI